MATIEIDRTSNRRGKKTARQRLAHASHCAVEALESRQLLSSVVTTFPIPSPNADSYYGGGHIVAGPDGNYWFTDTSDNAIGKVTPAGNVTLFTLPVHNVDDGSGDVSPDDPEPLDIVVGKNGNLWFTESGVDRIGEITTAGTISEFQTPSSDSYPEGLALGADGNVWFAETGNNIIGKISTAGKITEYPLSSLQSDVDGVVEGSDGNIWFIAHDANYDGVIARITPGGAVTSFPLDAESGDSSADPTALAAGPDGNLWVGTDSGSIQRVTTDGVVTSFAVPNNDSVTSIEPGANSTLWLALSGTDQFGSITTAGTVSAFSLPGQPDASLTDLIQGSDGALWFVDSNTPQVGKIDLTNALLASGASVSVTAGSAQTSTFASFTDFSGASSASDYTASLTLSDGSTLTGTITANSSGGFNVTASNTWKIGYESATVTITDTRDSSRVATTTDSISATAPQATGTGVDISSPAGQIFNGNVATFTGVAMNSLSSYSASINWGDGHTSTGTITANSSGGVDVSGTHAYADSGSFTVTTTLSPYPFFGYYPIDPILPPIGPLPPIAYPGGSPVPINGGTPVALPGGVSSHFGLATGGITGGVSGVAGNTIASIPGSNVKLTPPSVKFISPPISIGHLPAIGIYPYQGSGTASTTSTAIISAGVMEGTGYSVLASTTKPFDDAVADFTLADSSADLSHFHATVTWTDSGIQNWFYQLPNAPSTGVIASDGNGGFTVTVANNFANGGLYHFVVTISDDRLASGDASQVGIAYGQVVVDSPIIWLPIFLSGAGQTTSPNAVSNTAAVTADASNPALTEKPKTTSVTLAVKAGQTFKGNVGILTGIHTSTANLADLHGVIQWGDGTTSAASFVGGKGGKVTITGTHAFAQAGSQPITVNVTQTLYSKGVASTLYPLHLPTIHSAIKVKAAPTPTIKTGGIAITAQKQTTFSGPVAEFTTPSVPAGVTRAAMVFWGDGTHSTATVDANGNQITVTGNHTYRKTGKYRVLVQVTQKTAVGSSVKVTRLLASILTRAVVS